MTRSLAELPPFEGKTDHVTAVIETPKGHRGKLKYDPKRGLFALHHMLPEGTAFPYDFGFIPSTEGEDGDPIDVLVLVDEPQYPGCVVPARLVGVIEAHQTEPSGERVRNDRLIAVAASSALFDDVFDLGDLPDSVVGQIEAFFVASTTDTGNVFRPAGRRGARRARELLTASIKGRRPARRPARRAKPTRAR